MSRLTSKNDGTNKFFNLKIEIETHQPRTILEQVADTLVAGYGLVNWILILKLVSFLNLGNIRSNLLDQAGSDPQITL